MNTPADYLSLITTAMSVSPGAWRGALVTITELRQRTALTDAQLHQGILWGHMTGVLSLHGSGRILAGDDASQFLRMSNYYCVGVAIRGEK